VRLRASLLNTLSADVASLVLIYFLLSFQKGTRNKARKVLDAMINPYVALGMTCLSPLLECINSLVKLAQSRNVFICDFVASLTYCQVQPTFGNSFFEIFKVIICSTYCSPWFYQAQLYEMYEDGSRAFEGHHFLEFGNCMNSCTSRFIFSGR
jgi:hypothetical protein